MSDSTKRFFSGMKEAHEAFGFKGSYQHGTVYDKEGVIRSYSNGKHDDVIETDTIIYWIDVERPHIRSAFETSIRTKRPLNFFKKQKDGRVEWIGKWIVVKTDFNYAKLKKQVE